MLNIFNWCWERRTDCSKLNRYFEKESYIQNIMKILKRKENLYTFLLLHNDIVILCIHTYKTCQYLPSIQISKFTPLYHISVSGSFSIFDSISFIWRGVRIMFRISIVSLRILEHTEQKTPFLYIIGLEQHCEEI